MRELPSATVAPIPLMKSTAPARHFILPLLAVPMFLTSCGTMKMVSSAKEKTASTMSGLAKFSVRDLMPSKVPIVEVNEKGLKDMPTGEERALAYESKRKRSFWFFDGPIDFKEPTLPVDSGELDGSLLPPPE